MRTVRRVGVILASAGVALFLSACSGSGAPSSGLEMAGTWTVKTASTQGQANSSATGTVSQSGQGLGVNGTTLLTTPVGSTTVAQSGTALTGSVNNSMKGIVYKFNGSLSKGTLTLSGTIICNGTATETITLSGPITAKSVQGTYTTTREADCQTENDAGTFVATKE